MNLNRFQVWGHYDKFDEMKDHNNLLHSIFWVYTLGGLLNIVGKRKHVNSHHMYETLNLFTTINITIMDVLSNHSQVSSSSSDFIVDWQRRL